MRRISGEQRRKDIKTHRHASDQADGAFERFAGIADRGDGVVQVLKDPMAQLQQ
jgi:hypothetical protein